MGRKLRSMFKPVMARPGSGERPVRPISAPGGGGMLDGVVAGTIEEAGPPPGGGRGQQAPAVAGSPEAKAGTAHDEVARLAYERWLETGGSAVENWVWAEAELKRRAVSGRGL